jgi:hypothetical protein
MMLASIANKRSSLSVAVTALLLFDFSPACAFTLAGPSLAAAGVSSAFDRVWYDRYGHWHNPAHPHPEHMYVHPNEQHVDDPYVHPETGARHCFVDPTDHTGAVYCHPAT